MEGGDGVFSEGIDWCEMLKWASAEFEDIDWRYLGGQVMVGKRLEETK